MGALANAFGQMLGSYCGTHLFQHEDGHFAQAWLRRFVKTGGGSLPFMVVGTTFFFCTSVLAITLMPQEWHSSALGKTGMEEVTDTSTAAQAAPQVIGLPEAEVQIASLLHLPVKPKGSFDID